MKKINFLRTIPSLVVMFYLLSTGCSKKPEGLSGTCKTCTARSSTEQIIKTQEVCTAEAEAQFRSAYRETAVTCN